ncbi:exodeoxyribonuclease VII large subunit [Polluticaenibacter yanchengensis]|uniref:Exodeoxyribonuclease 7 large subunit n=1 Tax=Polluticaenibacter yanchengensis TaxID=3014562 RepID=A0ABT4ULW1_9BACT|nr:exodeoxyribonuclease VII large subunit [Chitinophagaceae bacterium LY-5]
MYTQNRKLQLSELTAIIQNTMEEIFFDESFWIVAEVIDVKKYPSKRWCFLKFVEKHRGQIAAEMQAVFWARGYTYIDLFERITGQKFSDGMEVVCRVSVSFHPKFGLKLEVLEIDASYTLGKVEQDRLLTIERLKTEHSDIVKEVDGSFVTYNNQKNIPVGIKKIALITAQNSDGERDFLHELKNNSYSYTFDVAIFHAQVQGNHAATEINNQLKKIAQRKDIDIVVIVRGGGSQTDLKAFDDYELALTIAGFEVPIFTGIGHDRNISIVDMMATPYKTPTKVAHAIVENNFNFENRLLKLEQQLADNISDILFTYETRLANAEKILQLKVPLLVQQKLSNIHQLKQDLKQGVFKTLETKKQQLALQKHTLDKEVSNKLTLKKQQLNSLNRVLNSLNVQSILNRGFAYIKINNNIIQSAAGIHIDNNIDIVMKDGNVAAKVLNINTNGEV